MAAPVTLRLDEKTRQRIARIARRQRVSLSHVIRDAIDRLVDQDRTPGAPYDLVADLVGIVHGGDPHRSTDTGRQFTERLKTRRRRS